MVSKSDQEFLGKFMQDAQGVNAFEITSVEQYRKVLHELLEDRKNSGPMPEVGQYISDVQIDANFSADIAVPERKSDGPLPVILLCHGNGGLAGSPHSYRRFTRDMAAAGYLCVTPNFRKGPEHRFPSGLDDLLACAHWIKGNVEQYGGDGSEIILLGDSIGANMALATTMRLQEAGDGPKVRAFVGLEGLYQRSVEEGWMLADYLPADCNMEELAADPLVSPAMGIVEGVSLPPILLMSGSADFALHSTIQLAAKFAEHHVPFEMHILDGMIHDFMKLPDLDGRDEGHRLMFQWLDALS